MLIQGAPVAYSHPQDYAEPPCARLGYLQPTLQQGQRRCASSRKQALTNLVQRRWASAAEERDAERAAAVLRRRLLCHRVVVALRAALVAAQAAALRADRLHQKWAYLRLGAAWEAWRGAVAARRRLAALAAEAVVLRRCTLAARSLAALQRHVAARRTKRRGAATADSFASFCLLVHALDAWRAAVDRAARSRCQVEAAVLHWARQLCSRVLLAWRSRVQQQLQRRTQLRQATDHRRRRLLGGALAGWTEVYRRLRDRRGAAAFAIHQALFGSEQQLKGMCLLGWRQRASRRGQLRDAADLAARLRRYGLLSAAWRGWLLWCSWQQHLCRLHSQLAALQPRLLLRCAVQRWQDAVSAAHAADGGVCHRALQLPRVFAAWQRLAQRSSELRLQGEWCERLLACRRRRAALLAWQHRAARQRALRSRLCRAEALRALRTQRAALFEWRHAAQGKAVMREQQQQAHLHRAAWLCRAALGRWRRVAGVRQASSRWRQLHLLRRAFSSWREKSAAAARKAERWRLAVRQDYLRQLWAGFQALRQHHHQRQQKGQRMQAMRQHYQGRLLRWCLAVWGGPYVAAARHQHALQQAAVRLWRHRLLQQALAAWHGPYLAAARQRRCMQLKASMHHTASLLRSACQGWQDWLGRQAEKQQRVAAAQGLLRPGRQRRVLAAWRAWRAASENQRQQVDLAEGSARRHALARAWAAWQLHLAMRRLKHSRMCAALLHSGRQAARRALSHWQAAAHTAALLRRLEPVQVEGQGQGQGQGPPADAAGAAPRAQAPGSDATARLLARLRRLRSAAEAAKRVGVGTRWDSLAGEAGAACSQAPPAAAAAAAAAQQLRRGSSLPAAGTLQPAGHQALWRALSIANLVDRPAKAAGPPPPLSDIVTDSCAAMHGGLGIVNSSSSTGAVGASSRQRPQPRRPVW